MKKPSQYSLIIWLLTAFALSCAQPGPKLPLNTTEVDAAGRPMTADKTTHCQLVEKEFVKKNGQATETKELYLRCSIQDYFIKLCESKVSEKALRAYLDEGIEVEMEVREGVWDICPDDPEEMQSRTGSYVVINRIVEE